MENNILRMKAFPFVQCNTIWGKISLKPVMAQICTGCYWHDALPAAGFCVKISLCRAVRHDQLTARRASCQAFPAVFPQSSLSP
jgi:hypothetical protein